jgi:hypothetical protein
MNVQKILAAAAVFVAAGSAFAADAPAAVAVAPLAASASSVVIASSLNSTSRAAMKAEAVEFVKNYKTAFAVQLDQYKN